jgi:hypothetical protein
MSWLIHMMRVILIFTGITPPGPEHERRVALASVAILCLMVLGFVLFLRWMTAFVMSH